MVLALLTTTMLLATLVCVTCGELQAESPTQAHQQPAPFEPFVIQGRITGMRGTLVTVKTPDAYPGARGGHPQFVLAGPTFRVNVSRARVLLPDGKQVDRLPLAVGDSVLMVLGGLDRQSPASSNPRDISQTYFASVIERLVQRDVIVTH